LKCCQCNAENIETDPKHEVIVLKDGNVEVWCMDQDGDHRYYWAGKITLGEGKNEYSTRS